VCPALRNQPKKSPVRFGKQVDHESPRPNKPDGVKEGASRKKKRIGAPRKKGGAPGQPAGVIRESRQYVTNRGKEQIFGVYQFHTAKGRLMGKNSNHWKGGGGVHWTRRDVTWRYELRGKRGFLKVKKNFADAKN